MKLTQAEKKWFDRLQRTLAAAPASLKKKSISKKISSYTVGDPFIIVYDEEKLADWKEEQNYMTGYELDVCKMVTYADAQLYHLDFPFAVESTAG